MNKTKQILLTLFVLGCIYFCLLLLLILSTSRTYPSKTPETVLILGAQIKGGTKETAYPSTVLKERLDTAISYLKQYPDVAIIVCGGQGEDEIDSEANVMANYLIKRGIPEKNIITENTSTRTKENIQNAQKKQSLGETVIVTSDFHTFRAKLLASRLGIKTVSTLPAISNSSVTTKMYFREIFSLGYALLFDW